MLKTTTAKGKKTYQRYYMRIVQSTSEQKKQLHNVLMEVLQLQFTAKKYMRDYYLSKTHAVPVEANYCLEPTGEVSVHRKVVLLGEPDKNVTETFSALIPSSNSLAALIPFYRDIAVEFFSTYKKVGIGLKAVENVVKKHQSYKLEDLTVKKTQLDALVDTLVYYRIHQEKHKAIKILRDSLRLHSVKEREKLTEYRKNDEQRGKLWLLLMRKLQIEGFGYFESNLAANSIAFPGAANPFLKGAKEISKPRFKTSHEWLDHVTADEEKNKWVHDWCEGENKLDTSRKQFVYATLRERELVEEQEVKAFAKATREWLIKFIESGKTQPQLIDKCTKAKYTLSETRRTLQIYEELLKEGYMETIILKVKKPEPVTFESITDSDLETTKIMLKALDDTFFDCMKNYIGTPPSKLADNEVWEKPHFETTFLHCVASVEKSGTARQLKWKPNASLIAQVKKLWLPSYKPEPKGEEN